MDTSRELTVELLHVFLLGVVKHMWLLVHSPLSDAKEAARSRDIRLQLEAADLTGLGVSSIHVDYYIRHYQTLTGKEYRVLAQLGSVIFRPMVEKEWISMEQWAVWEAIGDVGRLLYRSDIAANSVEDHLHRTSNALLSLANAIARFHPVTMITKLKWHKLFAHSAAHLRRFGPLAGVSTEIFESFHTVTRAISVHTNRRAPSRDIGRTFAVQEALRHLVRGGFYRENGEWRPAGEAVRAFMAANEPMARLLGLAESRSSSGASFAAQGSFADFYGSGSYMLDHKRVLLPDFVTLLSSESRPRPVAHFQTREDDQCGIGSVLCVLTQGGKAVSDLL